MLLCAIKIFIVFAIFTDPNRMHISFAKDAERKKVWERKNENDTMENENARWDMNALALCVTVAVNVNTFIWKPTFSANYSFLLFSLFFPCSFKTNTSPLSIILWMGSLKLTCLGEVLKKETRKNTHAHKIYVHPKDICLTSLALQHNTVLLFHFSVANINFFQSVVLLAGK